MESPPYGGQARRNKLLVSRGAQPPKRARAASFDHLVGNCEHPRRNGDAEGFRGLEIDDELEEILKFLGDGVLAVFLPPDGANVAVVAPAALAAARETLARVETLNAVETTAGNPPLSLNIALHAGEVTYGNIGTADRLDFTVIGPA